MDDLALTAETQEEVELMFWEWRRAVERRGRKVNLEKTKMMVTGGQVGDVVRVGRYPCDGVGCVVVVLGLTQFCVQHVGNGVIRDVQVWDTCAQRQCLFSGARPVLRAVLGRDCWCGAWCCW